MTWKGGFYRLNDDQKENSSRVDYWIAALSIKSRTIKQIAMAPYYKTGV